MTALVLTGTFIFLLVFLKSKIAFLMQKVIDLYSFMDIVYSMYLINCLIFLYFVLSSISNVLIRGLFFIGRRKGAILVEILKLDFITIF